MIYPSTVYSKINRKRLIYKPVFRTTFSEIRKTDHPKSITYGILHIFRVKLKSTIITRCSNNYGPYQFPEKLIPLIINNARSNRELPVYGDGKNVRDWLYVEDHCSALVTALEKGTPGHVYNIGGDNEMQNIEIIKILLKILGKPESLITFVKDRPGHDRRYAIDATKAKNELGWLPRTISHEGLEKTVNWYINNNEWMQKVVSGEYIKYYEEQYKK